MNKTAGGDPLDKVLIVDDIPTNIDLLKRILSDLDLELFFANSGDLSLRLAPRIMPDLILMDVMMPGLNGYQTCRELKKLPPFEDVPVIFITAMNDESALEQAFDAGGVDFISKPFRAEEVIRRVQNHLQIRCLMKERSLQIADLQRLNRQLEQSEAQIRAIVDTAADGILCADLNGVIMAFNKAAERMFGYQAEEIIGKSSALLFPDAVLENYSGKPLLGFLSESVSRNGMSSGNGESEVRHKNGRVFPAHIAVSEVKVAGEPDTLTAIIRDITRQKTMENELRQLAAIDGLTGIGNRRSFDEALKAEWIQAIRNNQALSLILFDIDNFKCYNDAFGHQAGDQCLQSIALEINALLDKDDFFARYGGDEFVILMASTSMEEAWQKAELLRSHVECLRLEHAPSSNAEVVTLSMGVGMVRPGKSTSDPDNLLKRADAGLYKAKEMGRNQVALDPAYTREQES